MALFVSFARYSELLAENREIYTPHVFSALTGGHPVRISRRC